MTGFDSKRSAAQDKLDDDADTLTIVYQRGFADGKKAAQRKPLTGEPQSLEERHTAEKRDRQNAAQRPWVGLTDEDRRKFAAAQYGWEELLIAAEGKLKERNNGP